MINSRKLTVTYWLSTVLFCVAMTFSAIMYVMNPHMKVAFSHLGFPSYFRVELASAKLLGVVIILLRPASRLTEWAFGMCPASHPWRSFRNFLRDLSAAARDVTRWKNKKLNTRTSANDIRAIF